MDKLHTGARWLFRARGLFIGAILSIFVSWILIPALGVFFSLMLGTDSNLIFGIFLGIFVYLSLVVIFAEIYARMSYNRWFYEFTGEGLRLERGIIWKRYSNIPYERIQNVDVHRGIIARTFGFSSVIIQTAGYSAYPAAEGSIPAVDANQAEQIRNFVMKKITKRKK